MVMVFECQPAFHRKRPRFRLVLVNDRHKHQEFNAGKSAFLYGFIARLY
jgi:hypothetical protein